MTKDFAIIPVKGLLDSKSRLSRALDPQDKKKLIIALLRDVLAAVEDAELFNRVLVVSPDPSVEKEAKLPAGTFFRQEGQGLNAGVRQSTLFATREKSSSVAVLLADIPLMEARDLKELYSAGDTTPRVVLSPSLKGGTNAMVREPPNIISPAYGRWSFSTHLRAAQKTGLSVYSVSNPRLSFDVDTPEDLIMMGRRDPNGKTHTARCLQEMTLLHSIARTSGSAH
ncbi:MAG: 2-phospho-L-lactate guanylyltransferase [Crenarchaeota archaeon 13_1_40CM_2_52_14]|nr:MAG: 2-phospho-L-lactate guanylyltransferase [Crenarchaeota archaeon 13_1_40CM_3_52_17]OLD34313.1 MAG: 2-phospho-L-lactate guanylyltransferase [Crenarchaeota archaeon 13_1_40CM_2_52_14]